MLLNHTHWAFKNNIYVIALKETFSEGHQKFPLKRHYRHTAWVHLQPTASPSSLAASLRQDIALWKRLQCRGIHSLQGDTFKTESAWSKRSDVFWGKRLLIVINSKDCRHLQRGQRSNIFLSFDSLKLQFTKPPPCLSALVGWWQNNRIIIIWWNHKTVGVNLKYDCCCCFFSLLWNFFLRSSRIC